MSDDMLNDKVVELQAVVQTLKHQLESTRRERDVLAVGCKNVEATESTRVRAKLVIYHDNLDPRVVSDMLGIDPSDSYRKDQTSGHSKTPQATGTWLLDSDPQITSNAPNEQIVWILDQIVNRHDVIRALIANDYRIEMHCSFGIDQSNATFALEPETMRRLVALNIPLSLDIFHEQ